MSSAVGLAIAVVTLLLPLGAAAENLAAGELTIRMHDYANVPPRAIAHAQRFVADLYASAGVAIRWAPTLQHVRGEHAPPHDLAGEDLTVSILTRHMTHSYAGSRDTMGFAAVGEGGDQVAYVLYDRVETVARLSSRLTMDLLGLVVAHEIGHLLLPRGSHSRTGVMRKAWHVNELQAMDVNAVRFTTSQAEHIRSRLRSGRSSRLD